MMFCFHILIALSLIIIQTSIIPFHGIFQRFYDLLLVFVIFLGLYRPLREGVPAVIILGFIMDSLSGSPLGIYTTSYIWIYGGCIWFLKLFHVHNRLFLIMMVAMAVALENFIFIIGLFLQTDNLDASNILLPMIFIQLVWAISTAPWLIIFINYMQKNLAQWYNTYLNRQNG